MHTNSDFTSNYADMSTISTNKISFYFIKKIKTRSLKSFILTKSEISTLQRERETRSYRETHNQKDACSQREAPSQREPCSHREA